ncbi:Paf1-domain-containing protein [Kalaharituber pfeilii]|nr:Paf1-domain-containing protein [Kalaharituber pfeilii]
MSRPASQPSSSAPGASGPTSSKQPPPPPNPPKLLDIPNPAVAQYTGTGFASKLAREQPLNVEIDSELGMPLDLVHVPGVFDRDESALRPIDPPPPVHPNDRALLRPASALGKPARTTTTGASGVSFLRRTEYISNESSRSTFKSTTSASLITSAPLAKKARSLAQKAEEESDPVRILAAVMRGFDIANPETVGHGYVAKPLGEDKSIKMAEENWKNVRHPTKKNVKPLAFYSVLPDPEALGELNGYLVYKFSSDPLGNAAIVNSKGEKRRDERVDAAMMRIRYLTEEVKTANAAASGSHSQSQKTAAAAPEGQMTLDFYVPSEASIASTRAIKRKFSDVEGAEDEASSRPGKNDEDDASPAPGSPHPDGVPPEGFKYQFVRAYEQHSVGDMTSTNTPSSNSTTGGTTSASTEVALILHDPERSPAGMCRREMPAGAYWYPIVWRSVLKPKRNERLAEGFFRPTTVGAKVAQLIKNEREVEEEGRVDLLSVRVRALVEEERARVKEGSRRFLGAAGGGGI